MNKFNPRPPHGGRRLPSYSRGWVLLFQSTPSAWRATSSALLALTMNLFQSTPSAWRATQALCILRQTRDDFNPRPPRGGRQFIRYQFTIRIDNFNPRPPRGGRHILSLVPEPHRQISIHALRVESDLISIFTSIMSTYFNPRPLRGGRRPADGLRVFKRLFQSTPSAWRATVLLKFR